MKIGHTSPHTLAKVMLVAASLFLNVFGNTWGAPAAWHPDEVTGHAIHMVKTSDLNPHYFTYGVMHYYVVAGLAVAPVAAVGRLASTAGLLDKTSEPSGNQTSLWWTIVTARTISALMAAAVVAMTIEIGARIFSPAAGLVAGLLLLPAPGWVMIAHFAIVDVGANFWYWLACLGTVSIWKTGARRAYLLSGIAAGLAIGTKIDRSLIIVPLVVAHLLRGRTGRHRDLVGALGMVLFTFVLSNSALVIAPFEFLDGLTRDLMFNALRPAAKQPLRQFALWVQWGLGTPLLILTAVGMGLGTIMLLRERRYSELVWLAATTVPGCLLYTVAPSLDRYVTVLFPALAVLAGYAMASMLTRGPRWQHLFAGAAVAAALGWSLLACLAVDLVLLRDPRYAAAEWLERNAPAGSRIAMDRGPSLSRSRYRVVQLSADSVIHEGDARTLERIRECGPCEWIRSAIFAAERRVARALGRSTDRSPYTAWHDVWADRVAAERDRPPDLPEADYVLLLPNRKPVTAKRLAAPGSGYQLVASFPAPRPFGMRPPFPFIGLPVEIYARHAP